MSRHDSGEAQELFGRRRLGDAYSLLAIPTIIADDRQQAGSYNIMSSELTT